MVKANVDLHAEIIGELMFNGRQVIAKGKLGTADVRNLLSAIECAYANSKTKRGKRIAELSSELCKLVDRETIIIETQSVIVNGPELILTGRSVFFGPDSTPKEIERALENLPKR